MRHSPASLALGCRAPNSAVAFEVAAEADLVGPGVVVVAAAAAVGPTSLNPGEKGPVVVVATKAIPYFAAWASCPYYFQCAGANDTDSSAHAWPAPCDASATFVRLLRTRPLSSRQQWEISQTKLRRHRSFRPRGLVAIKEACGELLEVTATAGTATVTMIPENKSERRAGSASDI